MELWMIWMILGVAFIVVEIFTPNFFFMSVGIGAIIAGVSSFLVYNLTAQIVIFLLFSFIIFLYLKKFSDKFFRRKDGDTNYFALKDKTGLVTKEIPAVGRGYVKIEGEEWSAVSVSGTQIQLSTKVRVVSIEGNKLLVSPINEEE